MRVRRIPTLFRRPFILTLGGLLAAATALWAQQQTTPHVGYVFPAGGRQGTSFQVKLGGQYLANITNAYVSGEGVEAKVVAYNKPLTQPELAALRDKLKALQDKRAAAQSARSGAAPAAGQAPPAWTAEDMRMVAEIRDKIAESQKRSAEPVIAEKVTLNISIAANAEPGERELRLGGPVALSEPLVFCVGQLPEFNKPDTSNATQMPAPVRPGNGNAQTAVAPVESRIVLPCVVNGQIMPGGVDRYRFEARQGQRLVLAATARELIPYLADAVPGWFQAALSLYDAQGRELASADHFRFHPDPVLYYEIPKDGEYVVQIRDSIYRGRDDFVYRITAGEVPYLTDLFPLGGPAGTQTTVHLTGWNLPASTLTEDDREIAAGVYPVSARAPDYISNHLPFAVDTLPECFSRETNNTQAAAQPVTLPIIINGRIEKPGQWQVFRFHGRAGEVVAAEVIARRLDSPLDSVLRLTDAAGRQLAYNDDYEDKGAGLQTQYADSYFRIALPATGDCYLYIGDAQHHGGPEYGYRLRVSPPRPDFALRVAPSSLSVRGGMSAPLTVYALRRDGFSNEINLTLKDAPAGFSLSGATVPANQDQVRLTVMAPSTSAAGVINLEMEGHALIGQQEVARPAVPAENMMQAFAYWHLVPSKELKVLIPDRPQFRLALKILDAGPVRIPDGGTAEVQVRTPSAAFYTNFQLELSQPPDGISIADVAPEGAGTRIVLRSDAAKIKPGVKGNLIVNVMPKRAVAAAGSGGGRGGQPRPALGALPAIPFEIVAP